MKKVVVLIGAVAVAGQLYAQRLKYPVTNKQYQVDSYFGTEVADPYRWLENDTSAETKAWVTAENEVTNAYLRQIPYRAGFKKRLQELINYEKYSIPFRKGDWFYFYKNDGLQNQSVLYRQKGLDGAAEVVIDPNKLSAEGTTRLANFVLSKDGHYAAWGISKGGSDWQTYFVRDMQSGANLNDTLNWVKVSGIAWQGDGFYYSRYPEPEKGTELSGRNGDHQVWFHKVGTAQSSDKLVYSGDRRSQRFYTAYTSDDERFVYLNISERGKGLEGNSLWYIDSADAEKKFKPVVEEIGHNSYSVIDNIGNKLLLLTNDKAKNYRVMLFDPAHPAIKEWKEVIDEKEEPLQDITSVGGKLFARYLKDVTSVVYEYDMNGKNPKVVELPGLGTASGFGGEKGDAFTFYSYSSFNFPGTVYKYDIATGKSTVFRQPKLGFDPTDYEVKQVFYLSKDNTKIPMFIVSKKGLALNSANPTLLYGYGGFNVSLTPSFSASLIAWLEQGGIYALANIRGGGEYGDRWHEAGMKLNKQNVFDDFIAAAEYLEGNRFTSPKYLSIRGGSNGGLLVGAVINQRPELFKVAIAQVGVMDMLRFQKFTIGWNWIPDYGTSDSLNQFKALYAYSPLHNISPVKKYPAVLITTADHDDRVVPAHSFKYAATLQDRYKGTNPILIRIDTNSGHGSSSTSKSIEETADIYSFILYNMGITPVFK